MIRALALLTVSMAAPSVWAQGARGIALFEEHCGQCHNAPGPGSRAPNREALRQRTPEAILDALTTGSMAPNARSLSIEQKRTLAEFLAGRTLGSTASGERVGDAESLRGRAAGRSVAGRGVERLGRRLGQLALSAGPRPA